MQHFENKVTKISLFSKLVHIMKETNFPH